MFWALRASGVIPRRKVFAILAVVFGAFGAFFLLKSWQLDVPGCLGAPVCAFSIVLLVFGIAFGIAAIVLAVLWAVGPRVGRLLPPVG